MPGRVQAAAITAVVIALGFPASFAVARFSQEPQEQVDIDLTARERIFPGVGAGMKELKRDSAGRYYILATPAASVSIYAADGKPIGPIPAAPSKDSGITFAEDIDVDGAGRVYVADRGANAIKIFDVDGRLAFSIPIVAPTAVAALPSGEVAVASLRSKHLVTVFDARGKWRRDFGDISDLAEHEQLNRFLNVGHLATDADGHIYYGFSYLPEPTVRKYDRYGYAASEISLTSLEFQPAALAARREIWRQDQRSGEVSLKPVINALAVEPQTQEVWVALGDRLLQFDRDGNRRGSYRTFASDGARIEPTAIVIEPSRLLLACDPLGVFEFARPDKREKPATTP